MKQIISSIVFLLCSFPGVAQNAVIDSLARALQIEKSDTGKAIILYNLSYYYQKYKPDSALLLAQEAYTISKKAKFVRGESNSLGQLGGAFNHLGNYLKALTYYIDQLKLEERRENPENIAFVYSDIALVYNSENDASKALYYAYKADSIVQQYHLTDFALYVSLNIGDIYYNNNQLDSALAYTRRCYSAALQQKDDLITGSALNNMGNIYAKSNQYLTALRSYQSSLPYLQQQQDDNALSECYLGLAKAYNNLAQPDSALYFAESSFRLASDNAFIKQALNASGFLAQLYQQQKHMDSAFSYLQTTLLLKDSFDASEKIRQLQSLTITEQMRQQEIADLRLEQAKEQRIKLQLLAIGICIPICFLISAFISRRSIHKKLIEFSGIFSLLLLFEYLTLLIHPIVAERTHHSPVLEILIFVGLAAIITPTHHRIEKWLISKLTFIHDAKAQARLQAHEKVEVKENKT